MELKEILSGCIDYRLLKVTINGQSFYPKCITIPNNNKIEIDDDMYDSVENDISISIDFEKLNRMTEFFTKLKGHEEELSDVNDFNNVQALFVLKELKGKENDIERLEYITEIIKNGGLVSGTFELGNYDKNEDDEDNYEDSEKDNEDSKIKSDRYMWYNLANELVRKGYQSKTGIYYDDETDLGFDDMW